MKHYVIQNLTDQELLVKFENGEDRKLQPDNLTWWYGNDDIENLQAYVDDGTIAVYYVDCDSNDFDFTPTTRSWKKDGF
jgi:hypothetical protein